MHITTAGDGDVELITHNGWFWDPFDLEWRAKVGPNRWLIAKGDLDSPPQFSPWQLV